MSKISYHTRLDADNKVKVSGGTFGGTVDYETVNRLAKAFFTVSIKPSGRAVFVDKEGREVNLYIKVDAETTSIGIEAKRVWRAEGHRQDYEDRLLREEIHSEMAKLTPEEVLRRLKSV